MPYTHSLCQMRHSEAQPQMHTQDQKDILLFPCIRREFLSHGVCIPTK